MPLQNYPNRLTNRRPGAARRLVGSFKLIVFLAVVCGGGWLLFQQTVHSQLRDRVQAKISAELSEFGLKASLGQARFHEGQGIQLTNVQIDLAETDLSGPHSSLEIYEAFLHAPATMTQLVSSEVKIQAVELRRARLTVVRTVDGTWDFQHLIDSLQSFKPDSPTPISLTDCEVRIVDQSNSRKSPITLSNVNLFSQQIVYEGRPLLQIQGGFQSPAISQIEFTTFLDQQAQTWQTQIGATNATLSADLITVLPPAVRAELKELHTISGKINLDAQATGNMSLDVIPSISLKGNVEGLTIDDSRLPLPIRNVSASFEANNDGFAISQARGKLGLADFSGTYWQRGFIERQQWHCDGKLTQFNLDHSPRLNQWIPDYCKKFCDEYSPSGTSNIEFDLTDDGVELKRKIIGELTNMSFAYVRLPYRVEHCTGKVNWIGDVCDFDLLSYSGKEEIGLKGWAKGLGKEPTYEVNISVPGDLPIDQKMFDAINAQPKLAAVIQAFRSTGRVGGSGKIEKRIPGGDVQKSFDVRLKRCSIRHDSFDYPIYNIVGLIQARNDDYSFLDLSGNNNSGNVTCNGNWNPIGGLNVRFLCESIPLDDQLRFALTPDLGEIWNGFRPRGTLDFMRVDMKWPIGGEVDLNVEASMEKPDNETEANYVSIYPVWFPYEINHVTGMINIGSGEISLNNFTGNHQRTQIYCQGDGRYSDDAWSVKLKDLLVTSLKVDEDLLDAVPHELAPPIRQLKYQGLVNVSGEVTIAGTSGGRVVAQPVTQVVAYKSDNASGGDFGSPGQLPITSFRPPTNSMAWNVQFDMNQAKMLVGVPIENVFGNVKLVGVYDGSTAECRGDLNIDSLTIYEAQLTNVRGPIWLDNYQVAAGQFANGRTDQSSTDINPVGAQLLDSESITGQLHKGEFKFDAKMDSGSNNEYFLQAILNDGCLSTACREFGADAENIEGHSYAALRLAGDYSGIHSQRGEGTIQLRDAKIYELPAFLSLLKILNVRQLTRTAFDSSNIDFTVQGDNIYFDRMEFIGDAISLIGNGEMNIDREIDLYFYTIMGRNRFNIPVLSDLYHASSQKIMVINVDGTLENPKTHHQSIFQLNELNDSIRLLFQPRENSTLANRFDRPSTRAANRFNSTPQPEDSETFRR